MNIIDKINNFLNEDSEGIQKQIDMVQGRIERLRNRLEHEMDDKRKSVMKIQIAELQDQLVDLREKKQTEQEKERKKD